MMYIQREPIGGLGENRVLSIFTLENLAGGLIGGGAMYGLAQALQIAGTGFGPGFWLQALLILIGMGLGAVITVRLSGLSLVDRIVCLIGFQFQRMAGKHIIDPPITSAAWVLDDTPDDLLPLLDQELLDAAFAEVHDGRA